MIKLKTVFIIAVVCMCGGAAYADIASKGYVDEQITDKAVHVEGDETISGQKTFEGAVLLNQAITDTSAENTAASIGWTQGQITDAHGKIPDGSATATDTVTIWFE